MKAKMKFERTKSMTYYYCPICMLNSTNKAEIEKHFREGHQVKVKKIHTLQYLWRRLGCTGIWRRGRQKASRAMLPKPY
jgi:hypothetical protein